MHPQYIYSSLTFYRYIRDLHSFPTRRSSDLDARDFRFAADQVQEANHARLGIDHRFVHVHVEQVCAALHLLTRDSQRAFEIAGQNQLRKLWRASNVGAFANDSETKVRRDLQRLEPG